MQDATSLKILVVEDFMTTRKAQLLMLEELGFRHLIEAENGRAALEILATEDNIGLIISDWNMPEQNGFELLLNVRANPRYSTIPFIMATAQGEIKQANLALESGANQMITKPFSAMELSAVIAEVSGTSKKTTTAAAQSLRKSAAGKAVIRVAHLQIVDHLVLGVLEHLIRSRELSPRYFEINSHCLPGWNPVRQELASGEADAAFMLTPLAMDLFHHGAPIRLVSLSHRNGSAAVRRRLPGDTERVLLDVSLHDFFKAKTFFLPHTMSIQHLLTDLFLAQLGLKLGPVGAPNANVFFEVVSPINMPEFLQKNPDAAGFTVAEPYCAMAIEAGIGERLFVSGEIWENHPCCGVVFRETFIQEHEDAVYEFVQMLIQAGQYIKQNPDAAAQIAVNFLDPAGQLGLGYRLLYNVLIHPSGMRTDDLFPFPEDFDLIQRYLKDRLRIGAIIDLERFIDVRFVDAVGTTRNRSFSKKPISEAIISGVAHSIAGVIQRRLTGNETIFGVREAEKLFEITESEDAVMFRLASDMKLVDRLIHKARTFLTQIGGTAFSGFNLILRELLINAVEHGNQNLPSKTVACSITRLRDGVFKITVADEGAGFDYRKLDLTFPQDPTRLRNRGFPLIKAVSEKIEFNDRGNEVTVYHQVVQETEFNAAVIEGWVIIKPSGDITAANTQKLTAKLKDFIVRGCKKYRFDLSRVSDIDSVGLSALIVLHKTLMNRNAAPDLEIVNATPETAMLFRMTNLDKSYRMIEG